MKSHVTTKGGDHGESSTLGGERVKKSHVIMEAVGTLDETRAHLALLRTGILASGNEAWQQDAEFLYWLLHICFPIGTELSDPTARHPEYRKVELLPAHLDRLETEQARVESRLSLPQSFIVCAGTPLAAQADLAATVARRLERAVVRLAEEAPRLTEGPLLPFLNRLNDYLFVLGRQLEEGKHLPVRYDVLENS
jgi:cob(I)alamin adenosyltransferase